MTATLYFFCGKMGAGKSTHAKKRVAECNGVLLSEDEWLASLYPGQITSFDDYITYSSRMKPLVKELVKQMLTAGSSVVMDFPANTIRQRRWFLTLAEEVSAEHEMIYLDVSDDQCLQQIAKRREEQPERAIFDTEAVFHQVTQYFEEPTAAEALTIRRFSH